MNIPKKVKILFETYDVEHKDKVMLDNIEYDGLIEHSKLKIQIPNYLSDNQKKVSFIHEVIHGLDRVFAIGLKERQVENLGTAIYQLMIDNPKIFS